MLYPAISDWFNSLGQAAVISDYQSNVSNMSDEVYQQALSDAQDYNEFIARYTSVSSALAATESDYDIDYDDLLNVGGIGVMGVLKIPTIDVELPIYHGTDASALQIGVGHYEGSSLPIGGSSTHSVLTGHTGLPSSTLLTDIDQLVEGDIFYIQVLNETLAYEVDQIKVVLPQELDDINVVSGEDYCTLVTCTPYGLNTHRLLVRGKRIAYVDMNSILDNEIAIFPLLLSIFIAILIYMVVSILKKKKRKKG